MTSEIKVLNHGFVKLVNAMGDDKAIVNSARVSYKGLLDDDPLYACITDEDKKLITSLIQRGHTSPFECVIFTFAVKAPIFVLRQWHRHRTWAFNEISARYKELPEEYYIPSVEIIGHQMKHEKQMRDTSTKNDNAYWMANLMDVHAKEAFKRYREMIDGGCPRELARSVLPVSTYSEMYGTVNLHNLVHFLKLRCDEHAQYEIRVYADAMLELVKNIVPYSMSEFEKQIKGE